MMIGKLLNGGKAEMTSLNTSSILALLNATLTSINGLVTVTTEQPSLVHAHILQTDYSVLIGVTGALRGRLLILGESSVFMKAGFAMYGMTLSQDMLESFVGEFGNSVAGHAATKLYEQGIKIDITPPTTMTGQVKLGGFNKALQVPFQMDGGASGQLVLAVEVS